MEDRCPSSLSSCDRLFVSGLTGSNLSNWYGSILFRLNACIRARVFVAGLYLCTRSRNTRAHITGPWLCILKTLTSRANMPLWRHGGILSAEIESKIKTSWTGKKQRTPLRASQIWGHVAFHVCAGDDSYEIHIYGTEESYRRWERAEFMLVESEIKKNNSDFELNFWGLE